MFHISYLPFGACRVSGRAQLEACRDGCRHLSSERQQNWHFNIPPGVCTRSRYCLHGLEMKSFVNLHKINRQVLRTSFFPPRSLQSREYLPQKAIRRASGLAGCSHLSANRRSIHCSAMSQQQEFQGQSVAELETWLQSYGIDTALYGSGAAKPLELLLEEVAEGETVLSAAAGTAQRAVSVVNVRVRNTKDQILYEAFQVLPTGSKRERNLPLSEKMLPGEQWKEAAARGIREELGPVLPPEAEINVEEDTYKRTDEKKESQSYPGLQTNVSKSFFGTVLFLISSRGYFIFSKRILFIEYSLMSLNSLFTFRSMYAIVLMPEYRVCLRITSQQLRRGQMVF